ncbi:neutral alpha-glucosidase AB-like [Liolophura sinensis]|uniref:neutral alpha-glucosidase AB-like n=1 Tax=Liolophura sinensis TaxID=3198878 RepID=UPI00315895EB
MFEVLSGCSKSLSRKPIIVEQVNKMALPSRWRSSSGMMGACRQMYALFVLFLLPWTLAVDRGNFKTCEQCGFCRRHRAMQPNQSPYVILMDSLVIHPYKIEVQVLNKVNNVKLHLELYALEENMARLKINELEPIKPRYEIPKGDVVTEPIFGSLDILAKETGSLTMSMHNNKVVMTAEPFRIDFFVDNEPLISVNTRGLLKFEHLRRREGWGSKLASGLYSWFSQPFREAKEAESPPEDDNQNDEEHKEEVESEDKNEDEEAEPVKEEEPDLWEESFKGHADSKPNGPTSIGLDVSFPGFQYVYGIPQHADSLALRSTKDMDPYRLFNLDVFEYELHSPMAIYGAVPFMIAHNEKRTVGMFWQNAAEMWIDIASNIADKNFLSKMVNLVVGDNEIPQIDTHWFAESGVIDIFFMFGPTPADIFKQNSVLTGSTPVPPLFGIAYHQSRWNYNDEDDVKTVDSNFDKHDIPYDVLWLDIEHTDGKRYFTWDKSRFPNPTEMVNNLTTKGRRLVTIVDPHLKRDDNYKVYTDAKNRGYLVKNKDGGDYDGWCWPGSSSWPDFINPEVRDWWANNFAFEEYEGSTENLMVWNDMNEPSVFNGPEITFHKDVKHFGDTENRDVHNIYAFYVHKATWDGLLKRSKNKLRPFVLTRGFFAGSQRYGAVWTGDNMGEWDHLKASVPMVLSLSLAGISFSGADVGGFFRNPEAELMTRWYQAGAYQPFFRAHSHLDTKRREPWLLPEENMKIIRHVIRERYALLPYWYTLFYEGSKGGPPPMRPLWVEFPQDKETFPIDDEYMLGKALLVKPVVEAAVTGFSVYFPGADQIWYDVVTHETYHGGQTTHINAPISKIPVFQRGGTIIPRKERIRRSSSLTYNDPFTLIICVDLKNEAEGELYIDDYVTTENKNAKYQLRKFTYRQNKLVNSKVNTTGTYTTKAWLERVVIIGLPKKPSKIEVSLPGGGSQSLEFNYNPSQHVLTIRKPAVNIGTDWTISLM